MERDLQALADRPAVLCWGGRGPFIGVAERRQFERLFAHQDTRVLPAAGHFVPEDAPQAMAGAVASAVTLWLGRAAASAAPTQPASEKQP
jgi:pimeloyl-ACP methyl ester carboxylesterase